MSREVREPQEATPESVGGSLTLLMVRADDCMTIGLSMDGRPVRRILHDLARTTDGESHYEDNSYRPSRELVVRFEELHDRAG
jgi:hypothetical protein